MLLQFKRFAGDVDPIAFDKLAAPPRLHLPVDAHLTRLDHNFGLSPGADDTFDFEKLVEPNRRHTFSKCAR